MWSYGFRLGIGLLLLASGTVLPAVSDVAHAVPAFAVQTGQLFAACHIGAFGPQLTPFGRAFKIGGRNRLKPGGHAARRKGRRARPSATAMTLYSGHDLQDDSGPAFLAPQGASYRFTVLHNDHHAQQQLFSQDNLVSDDQPGHLNAQVQDPNLINPWGVAFGPNGDFWVNNNGDRNIDALHG
jgi:hypothetical protein